MILYWWMIVQVIAESLPISSSGHVVVLQSFFIKILSHHDYAVSDMQAFDYALQGISAVVIFCYFFSSWWDLIVQQPMQCSSLYNRRLWTKTVPKIFLFGFVADGITLLFWLIDLQKYLHLPLTIGFVLTGCMLWSLQFCREKKDTTTWALQHAVAVGLAQGFALMPGVSRFASTLCILQWLGYQGRLAYTISFLLQWPLIVAGSIQGCIKLHNQAMISTMMGLPFVLILAGSMIIAYTLLQYMGFLIEKKIVWKISYYMIIPTVISLLL